jgi:ABC-type antimicrobial peptide transport system permease subunit
MYFPYWQAEGNYMQPTTLAIRTTGDPVSLAKAARHAVWSVNPNQPVSDVLTMDDVLDQEVQPRQVQAMLLGGFAALALALACVGIYGVMAYLVTQRNHEIGLRMALGARPGSILRLVLARGALLTLTGAGMGIGAAMIVTRLMRSLLSGVTPMDPLTIAGAAILLTVVALAACYIPARRAMRVDPMEALRHE